MGSTKLIYVAGPYRSARGIDGIFENIVLARRYARSIWLRGDVAICPHMNTAFMDSDDVPSDVWLEGDLLMLGRCDGIAMIPGWESSTGATDELEFAMSRGLDIEYLDVL